MGMRLVKKCSMHKHKLIANNDTCLFSEKRQTVLFSATQTRSVEDLARISLKKTPLYVGVDDHKEIATVDGLEQVRSFSCCYYTLYHTSIILSNLIG